MDFPKGVEAGLTEVCASWANLTKSRVFLDVDHSAMQNAYTCIPLVSKLVLLGGRYSWVSNVEGICGPAVGDKAESCQ